MPFSLFPATVMSSAVIVAVLLAPAVAGKGRATGAGQGVPNALQGFSKNRDQPITIEAAALETRDKKKQATFSGNVKVVRGDITMTSKALIVFYDSNGGNQPITRTERPGGRNGAAVLPPMQPPGPAGSSSIRRLEARSNVVVTQKDQIVTGEKAVFDTTTNLITMLGGVVLTQCNNVLRGDRLLVDMTTAFRASKWTMERSRDCSISRRKGAASAGPKAPANPFSNAIASE
jgi:lipopolysaccharide export system protein LptA